MKRLSLTIAPLVIAGLIASPTAHAVQQVWKNAGTDYNSGADWVSGTAPGAGSVGAFTTAATVQPNITASISNAGVFFSGVSGYDLTSSSTAVTLTLTGTATTAGSGESSNSTAAAIAATNTTGTNTVDAPIILAPATGTASTFTQAAGGTLVVNGDISSVTGTNLSLKGGGTIQLSGNNSFSTGSIDSANEIVIVGSDTALGAGTFSINSTATLQAAGGARSLSNNIVFGGTTTISGSNAFTFTGAASTSGANTRTITVSNTGGTTFNGTFTIQGNTSAGTAIFNGTSAVTLNGVVQDGAAGPGVLRYTGSSSLTLNNANTYSGGTQLTVAGGTIVANHDGAFGTGNVSLTAGTVTLTLQNGATQNYIADTATLSYVNTDTINLNYTGTDVVGGLVVDGVALSPGVYGASATNPDNAFIGNGTITVVPEPSTWAMIASGAGLLVGLQRLRRRRA